MSDEWFDRYLLEDDERDYAEEAYWRNRCPACDTQHERDEECADVPYAYSGSFTFGVYLPVEMTAPPVEPIEPTKPMSRKELVASGVVIGVIFLIVLACMAAGILPATT